MIKTNGGHLRNAQKTSKTSILKPSTDFGHKIQHSMSTTDFDALDDRTKQFPKKNKEQRVRFNPDSNETIIVENWKSYHVNDIEEKHRFFGCLVF